MGSATRSITILLLATAIIGTISALLPQSSLYPFNGFYYVTSLLLIAVAVYVLKDLKNLYKEYNTTGTISLHKHDRTVVLIGSIIAIATYIIISNTRFIEGQLLPKGFDTPAYITYFRIAATDPLYVFKAVGLEGSFLLILGGFLVYLGIDPLVLTLMLKALILIAIIILYGILTWTVTGSSMGWVFGSFIAAISVALFRMDRDLLGQAFALLLLLALIILYSRIITAEKAKHSLVSSFLLLLILLLISHLQTFIYLMFLLSFSGLMIALIGPNSESPISANCKRILLLSWILIIAVFGILVATLIVGKYDIVAKIIDTIFIGFQPGQAPWIQISNFFSYAGFLFIGLTTYSVFTLSVKLKKLDSQAAVVSQVVFIWSIITFSTLVASLFLISTNALILERIMIINPVPILAGIFFSDMVKYFSSIDRRRLSKIVGNVSVRRQTNSRRQQTNSRHTHRMFLLAILVCSCLITSSWYTWTFVDTHIDMRVFTPEFENGFYQELSPLDPSTLRFVLNWIFALFPSSYVYIGKIQDLIVGHQTLDEDIILSTVYMKYIVSEQKLLNFSDPESLGNKNIIILTRFYSGDTTIFGRTDLLKEIHNGVLLLDRNFLDYLKITRIRAFADRFALFPGWNYPDGWWDNSKLDWVESLWKGKPTALNTYQQQPKYEYNASYVLTPIFTGHYNLTIRYMDCSPEGFYSPLQVSINKTIIGEITYEGTGTPQITTFSPGLILTRGATYMLEISLKDISKQFAATLDYFELKYIGP